MRRVRSRVFGNYDNEGNAGGGRYNGHICRGKSRKRKRGQIGDICYSGVFVFSGGIERSHSPVDLNEVSILRRVGRATIRGHFSSRRERIPKNAVQKNGDACVISFRGGGEYNIFPR